MSVCIKSKGWSCKLRQIVIYFDNDKKSILHGTDGLIPILINCQNPGVFVLGLSRKVLFQIKEYK